MMRRLPWLLLTLLLYAHTLQAWHAPAHIGDFSLSSSQLAEDQACPFGANSHGTAATGSGWLAAFSAAPPAAIRYEPCLYLSSRAIRPPCRGPPASRH